MHTGTIYLLILLSILDLILLNADTYYSINNMHRKSYACYLLIPEGYYHGSTLVPVVVPVFFVTFPGWMEEEFPI